MILLTTQCVASLYTNTSYTFTHYYGSREVHFFYSVPIEPNPTVADGDCRIRFDRNGVKKVHLSASIHYREITDLLTHARAVSQKSILAPIIFEKC